MTKKFAATLVALCAVQGFACSPDGAEPPDDENSGALVDAAMVDAGGGDAAVMSTEAGSLDSGTITSADSGSGATQDARAQADLDAGHVADTGHPSANNPDASDTRDASEAGGSTTHEKASPGCGKSGRPSGGRVSVQGDHNYTFPAAYDGQEPLPLLIGFHAAGNPIEQIENLTKGSDFEKNYVRAFPKSKGSAWDYNADIAKVLAMYDDLMANHCIDMNRVFATGHSSGAQLIVQILTPARKADADHLRFKAVAPVAASRYGTVGRAIPVMYIQGQHDSVRNSDGSDVVKEFATANDCMAASKSYTAAPTCMSGGKTVMNNCIQYEGCSSPTVWCSHDDPQYGNTSHGWPCFATKAMHDFFAALP